MADRQKDTLNRNRRDFLKAAGFLTGSAMLAACAPSETKILNGNVKIENKTELWKDNFDLGILWALASRYGVPQEVETFKLDIQLLPDNSVRGGGDEHSAVDSNNNGVIQVAVGYYEEEIKESSGHLPTSQEDERRVSIRVSEAILYGYCQIASFKNLLPKERPEAISQDYLNSMQTGGDNQRLIVSMSFVKPSPPVETQLL